MEGTIQFINTTNNTKDNKINIGEMCYGVTAGKDKIYIGGRYKVIILNIDGSLVRKIPTDGTNYNLLYNERNDQLLLRQNGRLCIDPSPGIVTTALSVHGTTVIHQGLLVNDISSS
jgi:hypothetical protein